jgi:hypothetical protein
MMKSTILASAIASATGLVLALSAGTAAVAANDQSQTGGTSQTSPVIEKYRVPGTSNAPRPDTSYQSPDTDSSQGLAESELDLGNPVDSHLADNLVGTRIVGQAGKGIGTVEAIVRHKTTADLQAVVSVGGILGFGEKEVTIPLEDLRIEGMDLATPLAGTEEQLKARPPYQDSLYEEISGDEMVIVGSNRKPNIDKGLAGTESKGVSFNELDENRDGYLSKEETGDRRELSGSWNNLDRDRNDRVDQSEFSAFEAGDPLQAPGDPSKAKAVDPSRSGAPRPDIPAWAQPESLAPTN